MLLRSRSVAFFGPVLAGGCFIYLIQMFEDKKNRYFIF